MKIFPGFALVWYVLIFLLVYLNYAIIGMQGMLSYSILGINSNMCINYKNIDICYCELERDTPT